MLGDITSPRLLIVKSVLFTLGGVLATIAVFLQARMQADAWRVALAHGVGVWCFCRAYYFAFYVIERYIDPSHRFAGLLDAARWCVRSWKRPRKHN